MVGPSPPQKNKHLLMLVFLCEKVFELERRRRDARRPKSTSISEVRLVRRSVWQNRQRSEHPLRCEADLKRLTASSKESDNKDISMGASYRKRVFCIPKEKI